MTKKCTKCEEVKNISDFGRQKASKDGMKSICKSCAAEYRKAYYEKNKAKELATAAAWRKNNPKYFGQWTEKNRACGVYHITCEETGRIYYGSSTHIGRRIGNHLAALRHGKHWISEMQDDFDLYGEASFSYGTMLECTPEQRVSSEAEFVNEWVGDSKSYNSYRINVDGNNA